MRNLITNALHHGGREVTVGLTQFSGLSEIAVWDSGSTLTDGSAARLFDRFYTGQRPRTQPGSVGLGLFLSRQLAQLMGGDLGVTVGGPGTTFRLTLPNLEHGPVGRRASDPPNSPTQ